MLLAVPNVSEGRDASVIADLVASVRDVTLLDVHSDVDHNRTVLTVTGPPQRLVDACVALVASAARLIDLRSHTGAHPRVGAVDVLPFVGYTSPHAEAAAAAREAARRITAELGIPAYLYADASPDHLSLPSLRSGIARGQWATHPTAGAVCVGARAPLVAFNVDLAGPLEGARAVAATIRESAGGLKGVRALAFELTSRGLVQVSMNLVDPASTGPARAYEAVSELAASHLLRVVSAEVVGLVPEEYASELSWIPLVRPARTVEQALAGDEP